MRKIAVIAHGGSKIGMGHIARSVSLADGFSKEEYEISFASKYPAGKEIIRRNGYRLLPMKEEAEAGSGAGFQFGTEEELRSEMEEYRRLFKEKQDIIIVDSYLVSYDLFRELKRAAHCLVYIDDLCSFPYPVDILINGSLAAEALPYLKQTAPLLLLGLKYNLIRKEYADLPLRAIRVQAENIVITTGAADPHRMTEYFIKSLLSNHAAGLQYHVILGNSFAASLRESLAACCRGHANIVTYDSPATLRPILQDADLAITAGGNTVYEAMACGAVPLVFSYAGNQRKAVEIGQQKGYFCNLGFWDEIKRSGFTNKFNKLIQSREERETMQIAARGAVDGRGSQRAAAEIKACLDAFAG